MFQYAIDLALRCWIRRSACCRSLSVLSKKRRGASYDMNAHRIATSPGGNYPTPLLSMRHQRSVKQSVVLEPIGLAAMPYPVKSTLGPGRRVIDEPGAF
jgi:hypothetical protein